MHELLFLMKLSSFPNDTIVLWHCLRVPCHHPPGWSLPTEDVWLSETSSGRAGHGQSLAALAELGQTGVSVGTLPLSLTVARIGGRRHDVDLPRAKAERECPKCPPRFWCCCRDDYNRLQPERLRPPLRAPGRVSV